jgi:hypothetical protein
MSDREVYGTYGLCSIESYDHLFESLFCVVGNTEMISACHISEQMFQRCF